MEGLNMLAEQTFSKTPFGDIDLALCLPVLQPLHRSNLLAPPCAETYADVEHHLPIQMLTLHLEPPAMLKY